MQASSPTHATADEAIQTAIRLLRGARKTVALTGAGISVPSGIPDFRSRASGLWEKHDPTEVASIDGFKRSPESFYNWLQPLVSTIQKAKPNPAHQALAQLQQMGHLDEIVTQNIDGLHEAAGSRDVLAVHGHTQTASCLACSTQVETKPLWPTVLSGNVPRCDECQDPLKPDVVLFGELLPLAIMHRAKRAMDAADVVLAVGSSLVVYPVAGLPQRSLLQGGSMILLTLGETPYDKDAHVKIEADVADVLPRIVDGLKQGSTHS